MPHQLPETQTHLVPLTGDDCPSFGVMEQDAVVEERRVLGGRAASCEVMGTTRRRQRTARRPRGPPQSDGDHHEEMGTHHKVMEDHHEEIGDHPEAMGTTMK